MMKFWFIQEGNGKCNIAQREQFRIKSNQKGNEQSSNTILEQEID